MPYLKDKDQFYWDYNRQHNGATFKRDGSDYNPSYPKPKLSDARRVLANHFRPSTTFEITVVGYNLVYSSVAEPISAYSFYADMDSIENVSIMGGHGGGGFSIEDKIVSLGKFQLANDARITGIYFRALD